MSFDIPIDPSISDSVLAGVSSSASPDSNDESAQYSRPYKSRRQRPCDFCRRRKACCIIEGTIPCKLCRNFNRECTFLEGPVSRPKPKLDENGQRIVKKRKPAAEKEKDLENEKPKNKKKRGRKPKITSDLIDATLAGPQSESIEQHQAPTQRSSSLLQTHHVQRLQAQQAKPEVLRRFSAPVSAYDFKVNNHNQVNSLLDPLSEGNDLMVTAGHDLLIQNAHYSLEDHYDGATNSLSRGAAAEIRKTVDVNYAPLEDSPFLQAQKTAGFSKSPFFFGELHGEENIPLIEDAFGGSISTATSKSNSVALQSGSVSVSSLDSPHSPFGYQSRKEYFPMDEDFKSGGQQVIAHQFIEPESSNSYLDPYIFSLMDSNEDILLSDNLNINHGDGPLIVNYTADEERKISPKFVQHQRQIFEILDNHGDKLINLYLTYVNPFIPILSKGQIAFIFNDGDFTAKSIISRLKRMSLSLVSAIIASALEYWDLDNYLILHECPSIDAITEITYDLIFGEYDLRNYSYSQNNYDLLQACLIICIKGSFDVTKFQHLYKINILSRLISITHSITTELGLNIDCTRYGASSSNQEENIFRANLWWCFYVEEKWLSLLTGKQSLINDNCFNVKVKIETPQGLAPSGVASDSFLKVEKEEGINYSNYEQLHQQCSANFESMIRLTLIVSEILQKLYSINHADETDSDEDTKWEKLSKNISDLDSKLQAWKEQVPAFTASSPQEGIINDQSRLGAYLNADATLQVSYYVAQLSVHKALLKSFSQRASQLAANPDVDSLKLQSFESQFNSTMFKTIKSMMECFRSIRSMKLRDLNGFWYAFTNFQFIFIANFMILLPMVVRKASKSLQEGGQNLNSAATDQYKSTLLKLLLAYRKLVKDRSSKWKIVRLADDLFLKLKDIGSSKTANGTPLDLSKQSPDEQLISGVSNSLSHDSEGAASSSAFVESMSFDEESAKYGAMAFGGINLMA